MLNTVLHVVAQLECGGIQRLVTNISRTLEAHDVCYLYVKEPRAFRFFAGEALFQARPRGVKGGARLFHAMWRYFRRRRPAIVMAHGHYAAALVPPIAAIAGCSACVVVHHSEWRLYPKLCRIVVGLWIMTGFVRRQVCVSHAVLESLPKICRRRRTRVIYNGIEVLEEPKSAWNLNKELVRCVVIGRLAPEKKIDVAVKVVENCITSGLAVEMDIYGQGQERSSLRKLIESSGMCEKIRLREPVSPEVLRRTLGAYDVFLCCSVSEAFNLALVEAMQAGLICIASDIAAHREIGGDAVILVRPGDIKGFAKALWRIRFDPLWARRVACRGRERAKRFSLARCVEQYREVLNEVLNEMA